jgi:4a-hydroxytetrahydrobiopterin dehydratase
MAGAARPNALLEKRCVPCEGGMPTLTPEEIAPLLAQIQGWQVKEGKKLEKRFRFGDFVQAVAFVNAITPVAEDEGHHPDLYVTWGAVRVSLWTHAVGGLTENDFILAAKIDRVFDQQPGRK